MLKYHIQTKTLDGVAASISFDNIPQDFNDLYILVSSRTNRTASLTSPLCLSFNNSTSGYSGKRLYGYNTTVASDSLSTNQAGTGMIPVGMSSTASSTTNTFGSSNIYITNYQLAANKSVSGDGSAETNAADGENAIFAGLWSNTSAITSLTISPYWTGESFVAGTTVSLYGVRRGSDGIVNYPATGGTVTTSGGYTIHTFNTSGTFTTAKNLEVEYLVIGGGGGGGTNAGAGGGAGGYRSSVVGESSGGGASAETRLSLVSGSVYTVTVGAGGAGATGSGGSSAAGSNGTSSTFSSIVSLGGGWGGSGGFASPSIHSGNVGGSGGGAAAYGASGYNSFSGSAGTSNQGFAGGNASATTSQFTAAGGGGAGGVGTSVSSGDGTGGPGVSSSITGTAIVRASGGSGRTAAPPATGGGGGAGFAGTANTGGGGGEALAGGSGVVIIRYLTP